MDERPLLFIDSGLGGLPYGHFFHSHNRSERLICVADRANFPYGVKTREVVIQLLDSLTEKLISRYNPKLLALVCNTATVSALEHLREKYPGFPIVGTVPAIKPAVTASKTRCVGVIATERTIEDPYIQELAGRYGPDCEIIGIGAPLLVEFSQLRMWTASPSERIEAVRPYIEQFRAAGVDSIVLACTHFLHLAGEFRTAAGKDIVVYDSMEGVSRRVESILDEDGGKLRCEATVHCRANAHCGANAIERIPVLAVTGEDELEPCWEEYSRSFGFTLEKNP